MRTPVEILLAVAASGGKLDIAGERLRMLLPSGCPLALKDAIRAHKTGLISLLRLNFLLVHSDTLNASILWTPNEETKESLIAAGAEPSSIYSAEELRLLVKHRVTAGELLLIHAAKRQFNGRLNGS